MRFVTAIAMLAACEPAPDARHAPTIPTAPPLEPVAPRVVEHTRVDEPTIVPVAPSGPRLDISDPDVVQATLRAYTDRFRACADDFRGKVVVKVSVAPSGSVDEVAVAPPDAPPARCLAGVLRSTTFAASDAGFRFEHAIELGACNAGALARQGDASVAAGNAKAALAAYDAALACTYDSTIVPRAYAAACAAKVTGKARGYFAQLPVDRRPYLAPVCTGNGIDPIPFDPRVELDPAAIRMAMRRIEAELTECGDGRLGGTVRAELDVGVDGTVERVSVPDGAPYQDCIKSVLATASFPRGTTTTIAQQVTFYAHRPHPGDADSCRGADNLEDRADANFEHGTAVVALALYELALPCKPEVLPRMYMAACHAHAFDKARAYLQQLPVDRRMYYSQICLKEGAQWRPSP